MKKLLFMLAVLVSLPASAGSPSASSGCPIPKAEELICANVVCDFGRIMGEDSAECRQYKVDLAIYLSTLGFWDKPPKCHKRDMNCNKTGRAGKKTVSKSVCENEYGEIDNDCLRGLNVVNMDCSEKSGDEQVECYNQLASKNDLCKKEINGVLKEVPCDETESRGITVWEDDTRYSSLAEKYAGDPTVKIIPQGVFTIDMAPPGSVYYWTRDYNDALVMIIFLPSPKTASCKDLPPSEMLTCLGAGRSTPKDWPATCYASVVQFESCMHKYGY